MGISIGIPKHLVEDFMQEMYLRLNKYVKNPEKIMYNETDVNKFYVYVTIKNLYNDYLKERSKHHMVRLDDIEVNFESCRNNIRSTIKKTRSTKAKSRGKNA